MKLLVGLLIISSCFAQTSGQNVVIQHTTSTSSISSITTYTSPILQNIGQTTHQLQIFTSSVTSPYAITGVIQGSNDGTNFINIGSPINQASASSAGGQFLASGYKAYAYLRTVVTITPTALMTVDIWYTGSSSPSQNLIDMQVNTSSIMPQLTNAATGSFISVGTVLAGYKLTVYGASFIIPTTISAMQLGCSANASSFDSGYASTFLATNIAFTSVTPLVLPNSLRAYQQCATGSGLYINATGTGTIETVIYFRYE